MTIRRRLAMLAALACAAAVASACGADGEVAEAFAARAQPAVAAEEVAVTAQAAPVSPEPMVAPTLAYVVVSSEVPSLAVYDAPDGTITEQLSATATYGSPRTMLAVGDIDPASGWVQVQLPERWGHHYGWVRVADVALAETTVRVDIYLEERELEVVDGDTVVLTLPVAVGAPDTPTPLGLLYVTERIDVTSRPGGVYGPYILALSGYSESFTSFAGGKPQLAIHGTNAPSSIGKAASNGCIRVSNDQLTALVPLIGLGTPVQVHASRGDVGAQPGA